MLNLGQSRQNQYGLESRLKTFNHTWSDLAALTCLCLFTRLPWLFMVPMVEAPDEFSHYWVVKFIGEHARLPTRVDVFSGGPSAVYGPLPQIGYIPHVLLSKLLPFWDLTITARLGGLVMGWVLIVAAYFIARELYGDRRWIAMCLPAIILLHPQMVLLHAYINCDSTAVAASALIFLLVIRMIKNGLSLRGCSIVGLLAGLIALSKYASLAVVMAAGFGILAAGWLNGASLSLIVAACGITLSVFALSCSWWFAREMHEYPGDLLGTQAMRHIWAFYAHRPQTFKISVWQIIKSLSWWRMTYFSYWGMFGYMTRYLWRPFYFIYLAYQLLAIAGGALRIRAANKFAVQSMAKVHLQNKEDLTEEETDLLTPKYVSIYLIFLLSILVTLAAMIWSSSLNLGGAQGRYLFGCEVPIVALTMSGLLCFNNLRKGLGNKLVVSFVIFNLVVYIWSFVTLLQAYGGFLTKTY